MGAIRVVSVVLLFLCACSGGYDESSWDVCEATYVLLDSREFTKNSGADEPYYSVVLVGCQQTLSTLDERERELIHMWIGRYVSEQGETLLNQMQDRSYREELTELVNVSVQRDLITDVFLAEINIGN